MQSFMLLPFMPKARLRRMGITVNVAPEIGLWDTFSGKTFRILKLKSLGTCPKREKNISRYSLMVRLIDLKGI
jgi:hypothetical protein